MNLRVNGLTHSLIYSSAHPLITNQFLQTFTGTKRRCVSLRGLQASAVRKDSIRGRLPAEAIRQRAGLSASNVRSPARRLDGPRSAEPRSPRNLAVGLTGLEIT